MMRNELHAVVGSDGSWVHLFEDRDQAEAFRDLNDAVLHPGLIAHDTRSGQELVDQYGAMG